MVHIGGHYFNFCIIILPTTCRERISARDALRHPYILLYSPHIKRVHQINASGEHVLVRSGSKDSLTGVSITNAPAPNTGNTNNSNSGSTGNNSTAAGTPSSVGSYNYSTSAASTPPPANHHGIAEL
jgi:hypothetical protein